MVNLDLSIILSIDLKQPGRWIYDYSSIRTFDDNLVDQGNQIFVAVPQHYHQRMSTGVADTADATDDGAVGSRHFDTDELRIIAFATVGKHLLAQAEDTHVGSQICFIFRVNGFKFQDDLSSVHPRSYDVEYVGHPAVGCYEGNPAVLFEIVIRSLQGENFEFAFDAVGPGHPADEAEPVGRVGILLGHDRR
jgi:hypothetical protein